MIYQPKNVQPSYLSIDVNTSNNFRMTLDTNSSIISYDLKILDFFNNVVYQMNNNSLSPSLYNGDDLVIPIPTNIGLYNGNNYKWSVKLFQNDSNMLITYGYIQKTESSTSVYLQKNINIKSGMNVVINDESRKISSYNVETGLAVVETPFSFIPSVGQIYQIKSNFIETVPEYVFMARANPVISISNIVSNVTSKTFTFEGSYSQSDGVGLSYFTFNLYSLNNNVSTLIDTTGKVYSANIQYTYSGFKTGQTYQIELITETEYGIITNTGKINFSVNYDLINYLETPTATVQNDNSIRIDWQSPLSFEPNALDSSYNGYLKSDAISSQSFYIDKNLTNIITYLNYQEKGAFFPDYIYIDILWDLIYDYNPDTGLITTVGDINFSSAEIGDFYRIWGFASNRTGDSKILYDTPFVGVNSLDLADITLIYANEVNRNPIFQLPENFNITSQFKPNMDFYLGEDFIYHDLAPIAELNPLNGTYGLQGYLWIVTYKNTINCLRPQELNNVVNVQTLPSNINTPHKVKFASDLNLNETSFVYFIEQKNLVHIDDYDSDDNIATFNNELPFVPLAGDKYVLLNTQTANFYNPNNTWVLQSNPIAVLDNDYVWDDNSIWDDNRYWVEGGTELERVANNWWKFQITENNIKVEKGVN